MHNLRECFLINLLFFFVIFLLHFQLTTKHSFKRSNHFDQKIHSIEIESTRCSKKVSSLQESLIFLMLRYSVKLRSVCEIEDICYRWEFLLSVGVV